MHVWQRNTRGATHGIHGGIKSGVAEIQPVSGVICSFWLHAPTLTLVNNQCMGPSYLNDPDNTFPCSQPLFILYRGGLNTKIKIKKILKSKE